MPRIKGKAHSPRNKLLVGGVTRLSRSASYHAKGKWAVKNKKTVIPKKTTQTPVVTKKFGKKGETRVIRPNGPNSYPTEDLPTPLPSRRNKKHRPQELRSSITPGTVLILLVGRHKGRRVVFLKQLGSGLLLVTGPFKVNGVPLKRVAQSYVIATSKKIDISGVKIDDKFTDAYFKTEKKKAKKTETEFFAKETQEKHQPLAQRVEDQKAVDGALLPIIKKDPILVKYLSVKFGIGNKDRPHEMKF